MEGGERELARLAVETGLLEAAVLDPAAHPPAPWRYEIERRLGSGGCGTVYLARDVELQRPVAIKYLLDARPLDAERFFREARFAARLNNPSVVKIYDAGEAEGHPYIVMQYIAGGNLASVDLDLPSAVRVTRQVAAALQHAHAEGIVHRDIKPENILVDAEQRAFLTDFGIARDLRGEIGATISREGQIMGTPALMPPEQALGDVHSIDARSDVYALGATLYTKLAGRHPFIAGNVVDLLHAVVHDEPPHPRRFNAFIPRELEEAILRCLRKRREDRYASMGEVVAALDRSLSAGE
ncbi:MAG: serine/threonine-protein kinase, partial [Planctomycetota bacterium]